MKKRLPTRAGKILARLFQHAAEWFHNAAAHFLARARPALSGAWHLSACQLSQSFQQCAKRMRKGDDPDLPPPEPWTLNARSASALHRGGRRGASGVGGRRRPGPRLPRIRHAKAGLPDCARDPRGSGAPGARCSPGQRPRRTRRRQRIRTAWRCQLGRANRRAGVALQCASSAHLAPCTWTAGRCDDLFVAFGPCREIRRSTKGVRLTCGGQDLQVAPRSARPDRADRSAACPSRGAAG